MKSILQILLILSISLAATGKEYHVDGSATKPGKGSVAKPFKTIAQASKVMQKGDVCYIHAGTYRENLITKSSGTDSKPITFRPFNNDVVIISATEKVEGWELYKDNIYLKRGVEMNLGAGNNVFFNGQKMQLARWPNRTGSDPYELDARYINQEKGTWSMSFISNDEIQDIDWTGGIIHYLGAHSGCSWERTITGYDRDLHRVHFATLPDQWPFGSTHSPFRFENGHRGIFFLMNKLEALDAPNEWYYDAREKVLYVCTPDGTSPNDAHIEITARTNSAEIKNDFIRVENLNFFGGMVTITGSNNQLARCMVKHGSDRLVTDIKGAAMNDAAIQILGGDQNLIEKCVLESGTLNGIYLDSRAEDNLVQNNIIQYFNTIGIHAGLVNSGGAGNKFLRNSLYGSARDGVKVYGDNSEFGFNHVQKCLITGADGGLFYVTGQSIPKNIEVHHNWFHDAYGAEHAGKKATGIYLDNNSAGYIVHHNVVWDVEWAGLHFNWNAVKNEIYNNTFWNVGPPDQALIDCWVPKRDEKQTNVADNILYNNISDVRPWWHSGDGSKYRVDEKEFMGDEADNDFQNNKQFAEFPFSVDHATCFMPLAGSPLIDEGKVVKGITDGFTGSAPDLGAYEASGEYWVPGVDWTPEGFAWKVGSDYLKMERIQEKAPAKGIITPP